MIRTRHFLIHLVLLGVASPSAHHSHHPPPPDFLAHPIVRTISVDATSDVEVRPDIAIVSLRATTLDNSTEAGKFKTDAAVAKLFELLDDIGVAKSNRKAIGLSSHEEYDSKHKKFLGYRVSRNVVFTLEGENQMEIMELLINKALHNSDMWDIQNVKLDVKNKTEHLETATKFAISKAKRIAFNVAENLDLKLGFPTKVVHNSFHYAALAPMGFLRMKSLSPSEMGVTSSSDREMDNDDYPTSKVSFDHDWENQTVKLTSSIQIDFEATPDTTTTTLPLAISL